MTYIMRHIFLFLLNSVHALFVRLFYVMNLSIFFFSIQCTSLGIIAPKEWKKGESMITTIPFLSNTKIRSIASWLSWSNININLYVTSNGPTISRSYLKIWVRVRMATINVFDLATDLIRWLKRMRVWENNKLPRRVSI